MSYVLGLDPSTKTIGFAMFEDMGTYGKLKYLHHINPKVKLSHLKSKDRPSEVDKLSILIGKADLFKDLLESQYKDVGITKVIIEEPLVRSNNIRTVATLLRFNGMICKVVKEVLGITPEFISSYDARKYGFPDLLEIRKYRKNGDFIPEDKRSDKPVLFGGYPYDIDKKHIIYEKVSAREPNIKWLLNRKNNLSKENYDMCDAYTCVLGYMRMNERWD